MQPMFSLGGELAAESSDTVDPINPSILIWARETAGMALSEAAHALNIDDAKGKTGAERLVEYERGEATPSRSLLLRMAEKYRRTLLVFYLDAPPKRGDRGEDFRTVPGSRLAHDPTLDVLIRRIRGCQREVKSLLEDEEAVPVSLVSVASMERPTGAVVKLITDALGFRLEDFRHQSDVGDAFSYLRSRIENRGVFVLLAGNLGTYQTNIQPDIFRGFAIADPIAPFIVINDQDAHAAWSFTALHELTHILLGSTGLSGGTAATRLEKYCSDVASEILLPRNELRDLTYINALNDDDALRAVAAVAWDRRISAGMIAYRLLRADILSESRWSAMAGKLRAGRERREADGSGNGHGSYYATRRHRLGPALLNLVQRSLQAGSITPTKAGFVLGMRPRLVDRLFAPPLGARHS
jgi:Zn-dependent peptidase ImmA (M78 family)